MHIFCNTPNYRKAVASTRSLSKLYLNLELRNYMPVWHILCIQLFFNHNFFMHNLHITKCIHFVCPFWWVLTYRYINIYMYIYIICILSTLIKIWNSSIIQNILSCPFQVSIPIHCLRQQLIWFLLNKN